MRAFRLWQLLLSPRWVPYPRHLRYARRLSRRVPGETAQAVLAHLTLKHVAVDQNTPVDRILKFKEDHKSELGRFRAELSELTKSVEKDLPIEALQQRVADIYTNEVQPAIDNLKEALSESGIKHALKSLLKTSMFTVPAGSLMYLGLGSPLALLAMAGVSLSASAVLYGQERRKQLRKTRFRLSSRLRIASETTNEPQIHHRRSVSTFMSIVFADDLTTRCCGVHIPSRYVLTPSRRLTPVFFGL